MLHACVFDPLIRNCLIQLLAGHCIVYEGVSAVNNNTVNNCLKEDGILKIL